MAAEELKLEGAEEALRDRVVERVTDGAWNPATRRRGVCARMSSWCITQYTSWAFGRRLRAAGLLGSMRTVGDAFDNAVAESFFGTLQLEFLDRHRWSTRRELANAIFEWIEAFYNPTRRHSKVGMLSPIDYETMHAA